MGVHMEHNDKVPMFFSSEVGNVIFIYQVDGVYDDGYTITAVYNQAKKLHIETTDCIVEDVSPHDNKSLILETNSKNPMFNDTHGEQELVWYEDITDINHVLAACMI